MCKEHVPAWRMDQTQLGLWTETYIIHLCNSFLQAMPQHLYPYTIKLLAQKTCLLKWPWCLLMIQVLLLSCLYKRGYKWIYKQTGYKCMHSWCNIEELCILKSPIFSTIFKKPQYLTDNDLNNYSFSAGTMLSTRTSKCVQCDPKCLHHFLVFFLFPLKCIKDENFS